MPSAIHTAIDVALEWGIPAALTAVGAWVAVRWRRIRDWMRSAKARKAATEAMVNSWPTAMEYISGSKMRDDAAQLREVRVTSEFQAIREHLERQDKTLDAIESQLWGQMKLDPQARFICDASGRNTQVNSAYANEMRVGELDLTGFGWKNRIDPAERADYERSAVQAFKEHRKFERTVTFVRGDGTRLLGMVRLIPHPEDPEDLADGRLPLWFGSLVKVKEVE